MIGFLASLFSLGGLFYFGGSVDSELIRLDRGCALVVICVMA